MVQEIVTFKTALLQTGKDFLKVNHIDPADWLDMVAGGDPFSFSHDAAGNPMLGHGDVNEQIGREWISKDENGMRKADHLRDEATKKRKKGLHHEKLNVELKRCK